MTRSSNSARISLIHLQQKAEELRRQQRCKATGIYKHAWQNFNDLIVALDSRPTSWEDKLVLFVAQLVVERRPEATIKLYVSAVKAILQEDGIEIDRNSVFLASLLKSCKYTTEPSNLIRLPIQLPLLIADS